MKHAKIQRLLSAHHISLLIFIGSQSLESFLKFVNHLLGSANYVMQLSTLFNMMIVTFDFYL